MTNPCDSKSYLREIFLARQRTFAAGDGASAGGAIRDNFIEAGLAPAPGTVVSGYWPMAEEADVRPLMTYLSEAGMQIVLPVLNGRDRPLLFRAWRPGDKLAKASFGLMEPLESEPAYEPQLLLVPLVAFDPRGTRLGHGGGYYDRTLAHLRATAKTPPLAVGIAFGCQQFDTLPRESFDQLIDWVVTEAGATRFGLVEGR